MQIVMKILNNNPQRYSMANDGKKMNNENERLFR